MDNIFYVRCDECKRIMPDDDYWNGESVCVDCRKQGKCEMQEIYSDIGGEGGA